LVPQHITILSAVILKLPLDTLTSVRTDAMWHAKTVWVRLISRELQYWWFTCLLLELLLQKIKRNGYSFGMINLVYLLWDEENHALEMSFSFLPLYRDSKLVTDILQGLCDEF